MGTTWPYLTHPGPLAFAHRGAHSPGGPGENTLAAFAAAVDLGYSYVETDVHATADGVVVAFHDDQLDRVTDRTGAIAELRWSEVQQAKVGANGDPVPRLDELLATWPDLKVNIDPKSDGVVEPLARVLETSGAVDRVCCGSFDDGRLVRLRQLLGPELCTALGPRGTARLLGAAFRLPLGTPPAGCSQVPAHVWKLPLVTPRYVRAAHARDLQVHVWTIDDPVEMAALLDVGVDGLMTDRADLLKQVLVDRGEWA